MDISIFAVTGPMMIGPSSSHTAGAARLSRIARLIAGGEIRHVSFGLHGSFAKTYKGHGTDKALVAGALGLSEADEALAEAFELAAQAGLSYNFYEIELENVHENSVKMEFLLQDGQTREIVGSSIGGAQIVIRRIDGFDMEFTAESPTLIIRQRDAKGIVSDVSHILAENDLNIAVMRLSRTGRGDLACCIIETDDEIPSHAAEQIQALPNVLHAQVINLL